MTFGTAMPLCLTQFLANSMSESDVFSLFFGRLMLPTSFYRNLDLSLLAFN